MIHTYQELVSNFRPQFGNANHIAAVPLIVRVATLQERLDNIKEGRKPPRPLLKELEQLERRVVQLLRPGAKLSTYPPASPQL